MKIISRLKYFKVIKRRQATGVLGKLKKNVENPEHPLNDQRLAYYEP